MLISKELQDAMNAQISSEFGASMQYIGIASYFFNENLTLLSRLFFEQAEEEKEHAMKFVRYINETMGQLRIPAIAQAKFDFRSAEEAVEAALNWEKEVTGQITRLMDIAMEQKDYLAQNFLKWFVDEQLEEITKMDQLLGIVRRAGEKNLIMVEAYLAHLNKIE